MAFCNEDTEPPKCDQSVPSAQNSCCSVAGAGVHQRGTTAALHPRSSYWQEEEAWRGIRCTWRS